PPLRHHLAAGEADDPALGHPFAHAVFAGIQIAADLEETAAGVPAVGLVAIRSGRHMSEATPVHPHIAIVQLAAFTVDRAVALFVALDIDPQVVGLPGDVDADGPRHVQDGAVPDQCALLGADRDLAAGGQGDGSA